MFLTVFHFFSPSFIRNSRTEMTPIERQLMTYIFVPVFPIGVKPYTIAQDPNSYLRKNNLLNSFCDNYERAFFAMYFKIQICS